VPQPRGSSCWKFANAQLDERTLELTVGGALVELERKPLEVLRHLLQRAGEVVDHKELADAVWPGRILSESVLKKCISRLREVLGDDEHTVIKTVHGYGYRLLAPVEVTQPQSKVMLSPQFSLQAPSEIRNCAVLIVDIAGTVALRAQLGDGAAGRKIGHLLEAIVATARAQGGEFIKSYGDDILAVFEHNAIAAAAFVAVKAQQLAAQAGLQLYAGFHFGEVEFRQVMGHPDALGLTVNIAARLHKLTEGVPGRIFFAEESLAGLSPDLRTHAAQFGSRELRGLGPVSIWTLDWRGGETTTETAFMHKPALPGGKSALVLSHGAARERVAPAQKSCVVGRGKECAVRMPDPESRISSTHLLFECSDGRWFVQDVSRNGTWIRARSGEETALPYCKQTVLPIAGALCLGRPFAEDPDGRFTLSFELGK
jgi:adenylate cyclase